MQGEFHFKRGVCGSGGQDRRRHLPKQLKEEREEATCASREKNSQQREQFPASARPRRRVAGHGGSGQEARAAGGHGPRGQWDPS